MTTPIADFVKNYVRSDSLRLHMPGHKGNNFLGCEAFDITEISGADVLSSACGIIEESEKNASSLFSSAHSFYSTEGSSLAIKAMLTLIKKNSKKKSTKILAARNVHKSFVYACALLDIDVSWVYPSSAGHLCECKITPSELKTALESSNELPNAVYVTSPDYLGNILDIAGLSSVCDEYSVPLLVDNAHGAYLAFLKENMHPIHLGAHMCCDSAHKTLPVLTGGAYLHISEKYADLSVNQVREALSVFASTSPSYLILQSLDICNKYIGEGYLEKLDSFIHELNSLRARLSETGFPPLENTEPLKLVFSRHDCGYSGIELNQALNKSKIVPEFFDLDYLVLMLTPEITKSELERIFDVFSSLVSKKPTNKMIYNTVLTPKRVMSIRDAVFAPSETVPINKAKGRICSTPTVSCPPAVPIVISGELIDGYAIELMAYYGITDINVIV